MPSGLVALALGGFGFGLTEFLIAGLLPQVASDFAVSEATAGRLISGYALSVAVGAILLTAATARLPREQVLVGLVTLFVIGNLLSAIAPTYSVMLLGRIVAALCHGSFFGIGSLVAGSLVTFGLLAGSAVASVILVFLMGVAGFAGVPGMITRVTDAAHGAAPAASANVSASNVGNALGAWLGGLAVSAGLGYTAPLYTGAAIALASVVVMLVAARRAEPPPGGAEQVKGAG
ncbi:MFS transporter [Streptomyces sp. NPDC091215]|uniref:MFS transporter n=1 Tax=Streptomyces sp. NPDC091215 TaxID=3155192 RepID=UPI00341E8FE3